MFEEAPKPLPGLAGESRSADANGSWFRVLAAGGKNLVTLKPGVFATTPEPLLGANPPKPKTRPPLNADVACETQEAPDLRTNPAAPPEQKTVDTNSPAFQARYALARAKAIKWLERPAEGRGPRRQAEDRRRGRDAAADRQDRRTGEGGPVTAIRKHAKEFVAVLGPDRGRRRRVAVPARPAADAVPVGGLRRCG